MVTEDFTRGAKSWVYVWASPPGGAETLEGSTFFRGPPNELGAKESMATGVYGRAKHQRRQVDEEPAEYGGFCRTDMASCGWKSYPRRGVSQLEVIGRIEFRQYLRSTFVR